MKLKRAWLILTQALVIGSIAGSVARAADSTPALPFLHPLFSDHVVLQRGVKVPVWGWTKPGAKVTVTFGGQTRSAVAQPDGKWTVRLSAMPVSVEPRTLSVSDPADNQSATVQDVLVGDVWLCSGQSNMEMGIGVCNAPNDIAQANYPHIRLLTVPRLIANSPVQTFEGRWLPCSPENVTKGLWGGFSAAGYFFGRDLYRHLNVPIGLIHSSWGGTLAEAWTSAQGLQPLGDFDQRLEQVAKASQGQKPDYDAEYEQWARKND